MLKKSKIILTAVLLSGAIGCATVANAQTSLENEGALSTSTAVGSLKAKKYFWTDTELEGKIFDGKYKTVGLIIDGKLQATTAVNSRGIFKFLYTTRYDLYSSKKTFDIVGIDENGQFGERVHYKVYPKFHTDYRMTVASYKLGETTINGTTEAGIDTVALRVNNKVVRKELTTLEANGEETYSIFVKHLNLKTTDKVEIVGYDSHGNTREVLTVKVTN